MFLKLGSTNGSGKRRFPLCCFKKEDAYDIKKANNNNNNENEEEKVADKKDILMKFLCLVTVTVQNAAYVQVLKYTRIGVKEDLFITSTAVCLAEGLKLCSSCLLMVTCGKSWRVFHMFLYNSIIEKPLDTLNVGIPAVCYVVMNNLTYVSSTHLDVITFQIISQLKIPATVLFSILLLRSSFRKLQYLSLIMLMVGAAVVQVTEVEDHSNRNSNNESSFGKLVVTNRTLGIVTGMIACCLSGFAGVYFERILKRNSLDVWARNVQLSVLSLPPAFAQTFIYDRDVVNSKGFFHGYNYLVWIVIVLQVFGGLIIALSMKLADNVSKGYATAASIVVSGISSTLLFHYRFSYQFAFGAMLVVLSIPFYAVTFKSTKIEPVKMNPEEGGGECYI